MITRIHVFGLAILLSCTSSCLTKASCGEHIVDNHLQRWMKIAYRCLPRPVPELTENSLLPPTELGWKRPKLSALERFFRTCLEWEFNNFIGRNLKEMNYYELKQAWLIGKKRGFDAAIKPIVGVYPAASYTPQPSVSVWNPYTYRYESLSTDKRNVIFIEYGNILIQNHNDYLRVHFRGRADFTYGAANLSIDGRNGERLCASLTHSENRNMELCEKLKDNPLIYYRFRSKPHNRNSLFEDIERLSDE